jgi:DNA-binding transcriptional LysR family regulator
VSLTQLRAFLAALRTASFTAAAAELGMAQPSVSELIRRMEDEYGLPLFVRGGRRLVLTAAGEELRPFAEQAVAAVDHGVQALRALRQLGGGTATFGLLRNAGYYQLSDVVQEFHARYPDVRVRLVGQNSVDVAAAVAEGDLEAGLVVLPIDDSGLEVTPLLRDEVLYASSSPEWLAAPMTMERLSSAPLILYDAHYGWRDPTRRQLAERAQMEGFKLEPMIEVEHVEAALRLVGQGVGDTIVSRAVVHSVACPPGVETVVFAEPLYDTIAFVQRQGTVLSPATQELARMARSKLEAGVAPPVLP